MSDVSHATPQSFEAEEAVLGAMMISPMAVEVVNELGIKAPDFYRLSHRTIFDAILELAEKDIVDETTVVMHLKATNKLGDVGGHAAVLSLVERVPAVANARAYAQEVLDQATLRRLVETGHAIATLGYEHPHDPPSLVDEAGRLVDEMSSHREQIEGGEWTTFGDELDPLLASLEDRKNRGVALVGVSSGLDVLDARWGGLQGGRLYIAAGRPGMGKSAWLSTVCEHVSVNLGQHVALFNFEMNPEQQTKRGAARQGDADLHRMTSGLPTDSDLASVTETKARIYANARRLHINRRASMSMRQIALSARRLNRRLKRSTGAGLAMVAVDYLQLVETPGSRAENRTADLSQISRALKSLAMELDVPVVALSQLNRSVESRTPPVPILSDLRESGAIEQDADVVLLLYRPEYYLKDDTPAEWRCKAQAITAKWRDGVPGTDVLGWDGPRTKYIHARDARPPFHVGGAHGGEIT